MPVAVLQSAGPGAYELRGGNRELFRSRDPEVVLSGPADTGKTVAACVKAHLTCAICPDCCGAIARKVRASATGTVIRRFLQVVKGQGVKVLGGDSPTGFVYGNGSRLWVSGLDDPGKLLSADLDFVYVNQAEELTESDWEVLATRCSGRAGHVQYPQVFGDCNPGGSHHWIRRRAADGKLRLLVSKHEDNPSLYDKDGNITQDGVRRISVLDNLTGVRKLRLKNGVWATAEGAVYDTFETSVHVKVRQPGEMKRWLLAVDEGYTNPAVCLLVGEDGDGRRHCFREFYRRGVLPSDFVALVKQWFENPFPGVRCELAAVDESAAGLIADLQRAGVYAVGGKGRVLDGINKVQDRLKVQPDGRPRYTVDPSCAEHVNEFESYVWAPDKPKDTPVKDFDHSLDALRYLEAVCGDSRGGFAGVDGAFTGSSVEREAADFQRLGLDDF